MLLAEPLHQLEEPRGAAGEEGIRLALRNQVFEDPLDVPGQVAVEQIMVCGFGACYVCVRTFEVDGKRVLRRVCREGPVFNMQEAVGW